MGPYGPYQPYPQYQYPHQQMVEFQSMTWGGAIKQYFLALSPWGAGFLLATLRFFFFWFLRLLPEEVAAAASTVLAVDDVSVIGVLDDIIIAALAVIWPFVLALQGIWVVIRVCWIHHKGNQNPSWR